MTTLMQEIARLLREHDGRAAHELEESQKHFLREVEAAIRNQCHCCNLTAVLAVRQAA